MKYGSKSRCHETTAKFKLSPCVFSGAEKIFSKSWKLIGRKVLTHLGFALRCLKKVPKIFSQMVVNDGDESIPIRKISPEIQIQVIGI